MYSAVHLDLLNYANFAELQHSFKDNIWKEKVIINWNNYKSIQTITIHTMVVNKKFQNTLKLSILIKRSHSPSKNKQLNLQKTSLFAEQT